MSKEIKPFLSDIRFHAPETVEKALELLQGLQGARVMAGGTDLLVDLKQGLIEVKNVVSLQKLEELKGIELVDDKIRIGALVTPRSIMTHPIINRYLPALSGYSLCRGSQKEGTWHRPSPSNDEKPSGTERGACSSNACL